jgi:hypothetical protein
LLQGFLSYSCKGFTIEKGSVTAKILQSPLGKVTLSLRIPIAFFCIFWPASLPNGFVWIITMGCISRTTQTACATESGPKWAIPYLMGRKESYCFDFRVNGSWAGRGGSSV